jgi:protein TonB
VEVAQAGTAARPAAQRVSPAVLAKPKLLAAGAGAILLLIAGIWMFSGSESDDVGATVADTDVVATAEDSVVPRIVESEVPQQPAAELPDVTGPTYADLLDEARIARDAGEFIRPPGSSAIELYVAAREAAPGDVAIVSELADVVNSVLGIAESALLAGNSLEAEDSIRMVRMATPDNPRLPFLDAQLSQLQYRSALDNARTAIRETRFEDAATFLANAQSIAVLDKSEVGVLADELSRSRSEQRIDEVLAIAAQRLEEDRLTSPANDNARYYYELALSNDANNAAAQQGLVFVAGKLVLKARAAIDNGQLDQAAEFLEDATALDPNSSELAASTLALKSARQARIDAARRAESERLAAIEREAEAARQAELERRAAAERAAEAERIAEEQRESEARRQAAAALAAASVAASPSSEPATPGGSTQPGTLAANEPGSGALQATEPGTENPLQSASTGDNAAAASSQQDSSDTSSPEQAVAATSAGAVADAGASGAAQEPPMVGVNVLTRLHYISPKYPRSAMRRGVTGYVDLSLTIARDGSVYNVIVLSADPKSTFDEAAIEAISQWKFQPVIEAGVPVERRTAVRMAFELE